LTRPLLQISKNYSPPRERVFLLSPPGFMDLCRSRSSLSTECSFFLEKLTEMLFFSFAASKLMRDASCILFNVCPLVTRTSLFSVMKPLSQFRRAKKQPLMKKGSLSPVIREMTEKSSPFLLLSRFLETPPPLSFRKW